MPKKRRQRARYRDPAAVRNTRASTGTPQRSREDVVRMPSTTARLTGFAIALVTEFLGGITLWNGASSGGTNGVLEVIVGVFLIALGIAVAALCIVPERVRDLFVR